MSKHKKIPLINYEEPTKIEGLGTLLHSSAWRFDKGVRALRKLGARCPISLRDLAYVMISTGYESPISQSGSCVREAAMYRWKNPILLVRNAPFLSDRFFRTFAYKWENFRKEVAQGIEHGVDSDIFFEAGINPLYYDLWLRRAEQDKVKSPKDRRALIINQGGDYTIQTRDFGQEEVCLWAFQDQAERVGKFLRDFGIREILLMLSETDDELAFLPSKPDHVHQMNLWGLMENETRFLLDGATVDYMSFNWAGILEEKPQTA